MLSSSLSNQIPCKNTAQALIFWGRCFLPNLSSSLQISSDVQLLLSPQGDSLNSEGYFPVLVIFCLQTHSHTNSHCLPKVVDDLIIATSNNTNDLDVENIVGRHVRSDSLAATKGDERERERERERLTRCLHNVGVVYHRDHGE